MQNQGAKGAGGTFSQGTYLANGPFGDTDISYNTFRSSPGCTPTGSNGNGGVQMHFWVSGIARGEMAGTSYTINYNYADLRNCSGFAYSRTNVSFTGNVNMRTGASLDVSG
jgi:hypothetical protein